MGPRAGSSPSPGFQQAGGAWRTRRAYCRTAGVVSRRLAVGGTFHVEALEPRLLLAAVAWTGAAGDNLWHTPGNWDSGVVPGAADDVTIDVAGTPTILFTASTGSQSIRSLLSREPLSFSGGTLSVQSTATLEAGATLAGGTLSGGTWSFVGEPLTVTVGGVTRLVDILIHGDVVLSHSFSRLRVGGTVTVASGTMQLSGSEAGLGFENGAFLTAEIVVGNGGWRRIGPTASDVTATLGPGSILRGGSAEITRSFSGIQRNNFTLISHATIDAQTPGQTITLGSVSMMLSNHGLLVASAGTLSIEAQNWSGTGALAATGGTLNIGGACTTADLNLPAFIRSGGTVNLTGFLDNTGQTLALNDQTGPWTLYRGAISGGSVNVAAVGGLRVEGGGNSGRLVNVAITGDVIIESPSIGWTSPLLLGGAVSMTAGAFRLSGTLPSLALEDGASLSAEVLFLGSGKLGPAAHEVTAVLAPGTVVRGGGGSISNSIGSSGMVGFVLLNHGTVDADVAGGTIAAGSGMTFLNHGVLTASAGTLTLTSVITSATGSMAVTGGTLNLGGSFTTGDLNLRAFTRSGGTVNITGTLDNSSSTLTLNAQTGPWHLQNGALTGGTLVIAPGGGFIVASPGPARLADISLSGTILLEPSSTSGARVRIGGTVAGGAFVLSGFGAELGLENGALLDSEIVFSGTGQFRGIGPAASSVTATLGPNAVVRGGGGSISSTFYGTSRANFVLHNLGTINADAAGSTITLSNTGMTVIQNGWLRADGGVLRLSGQWNDGLGQFGSSQGGSIRLNGTVNNAGGTIVLTPQTGGLVLEAGQISGGALDTGGLLTIAGGLNPSRLADVQLTGSVLLDAAGEWASYLRIGGTVNGGTFMLTGPGAALGLENGAVLNSEVVFAGAGLPRRIGPADSNVTATLGPDAVVRGGNGIIDRDFRGLWPGFILFNQGMLSADVPGQAITITSTITLGNYSAGTLTGGTWHIADGAALTTSFGVITHNAATVILEGAAAWPAASGIATNSGTLALLGGRDHSIAGLFTNTGILTLSPGSTLSAGSFVQAAAAVLQIQAAAAANFGRLLVAGSVELAGTLEIEAIGNYTPARGDNIQFLTAASVNGAFASTSVPAVAAALKAPVIYEPGGVRLLVTSIADANNDGTVDSTDISFFVTQWITSLLNGTLIGDFDGDGVITSADISAFINAWLAAL